MKTVLVPGVPWPSKDEKVMERRRDPKKTDLSFEAWLEKHKLTLKNDICKKRT